MQWILDIEKWSQERTNFKLHHAYNICHRAWAPLHYILELRKGKLGSAASGQHSSSPKTPCKGKRDILKMPKFHPNGTSHLTP